MLILDHVKIQQEKDEKTNSLQPVPKKIYQINASLLSEKFIFYINILSWERLKYPEGDSPISVSFLGLIFWGVLKNLF